MKRRIAHFLVLISIGFILFSLSSKVYCQPFDSLWMYSYGHDELNDEAHDITQKYDSGYILVGYSYPSSVWNYDAYMISIDKEGQLLWEKQFASPGHDRFLDIINTADSNYLIGGEFNDQAWLVKMTNDGDTLWTRSFGDSFGSITSMQELSNKDIIITGNPANPNNYNFYQIRADQYGDSIWTHKYLINNTSLQWHIKSRCVKQTSDGGFMLSTGGMTVWGYPISVIVKTDSNGDTLWSKRKINDINFTYIYLNDLLIDEDTVYVFGTNTTNLGNILIFKMKSNGDVIWVKEYVNEDITSWYGYFGAHTNKGTIIIAGVSEVYTNGIFICEMKKDGDFIWEKSYGKVEIGYFARSIIKSFGNNYIVAGNNYSIKDFFVLKLGKKPSQINPINEQNNIDLQIFPNPVMENAHIEFSITSKAFIKITIYDLNGKEIATLTNKLFQRGKHQLFWDASAFPNGIYFCKFEFEEQVLTKKIIIAK